MISYICVFLGLFHQMSTGYHSGHLPVCSLQVWLEHSKFVLFGSCQSWTTSRTIERCLLRCFGIGGDDRWPAWNRSNQIPIRKWAVVFENIQLSLDQANLFGHNHVDLLWIHGRGIICWCSSYYWCWYVWSILISSYWFQSIIIISWFGSNLFLARHWFVVCSRQDSLGAYQWSTPSEATQLRVD